jgi:hypothetical protein
MEYEREEQFGGPKESREKMREFLNAYFVKLVDKEIILKYKIRNSFTP